MRIVPNYKILGLSGLMLLSPYLLSSCQKKEESPKPMYNVTLTEHSPSQKSFNTVMEDGCSVEFKDKKYIMSNGQLYKIDKKTNDIKEADTIHANDYQTYLLSFVFTHYGLPHQADTRFFTAKNIRNVVDRLKDDYNSMQPTLVSSGGRNVTNYNTLDCVDAFVDNDNKEITNGVNLNCIDPYSHTNVIVRYNDTIPE